MHSGTTQSCTTFGHRDHKAPIFNRIFRLALVGAAAIVAQAGPASAVSIGSSASLPIITQQEGSGNVVQVRAVARRGGVAVGPRGGAVAYRSRTVVGPGVRPGWHGGGTRWVGPRPGGWARPGWYGWPVGGAVAAGAAIGFVSAASAAAWAGPAPAAGMCWYYTDPSRTQGFWDYCSR
ncbi:hypothetical protein ACVIHI_004699 [Bradyrhizobium sp. USDA 4524]|uniref:hypothetical protein n=1 Tax=unclassified Bradyrhizobium TaxID=2631580 RepID=UPI0020A14EC4|nr:MULTISPECIES: hypothetical protein [unclassified Bradyrhizobium]MCP1902947.1 hypothetical protein [Bradyrhizobium sp. USDA 4537]